jgi:hypothetical protein
MATVAVPEQEAILAVGAAQARPPTGVGRLGYPIFLVAVWVIALHVADDSSLQPQPGTSAGEHLVSGLVPLGVLALAAALYTPVRSGARAAIALLLGVFGIVAGIEAAHYTTQVGPSGDDFTGLLSLIAIHEPPFGPAGLTLFIIAVLLFARQQASAPAINPAAVPSREVGGAQRAERATPTR